MLASDMSSTRKIIRAFLASPGDLQDERKAIRGAVEEFNDTWANVLGYQIELVGWEETVAGYGRPQHLINQDLDRCDLFLGMIWKKWGTPPDSEGHFSSGFEEEFTRSVARRDKDGSPEISLFFKQIPDEFMADPGDDLKKVLEFQEKIIAGKKILYQQFTTMRDIETLVRKCVSAYVNRVRSEDESSEIEDLPAKSAPSDSNEVSEDGADRDSSPLSAEGFEFLENLMERIRQPDSLNMLSASDIARFRLLANSISKSGNQEMNVGVHDINILFAAHAQGLELGEKEMLALARLGFRHLTNENVPLWCWYSALEDSRFNPVFPSSVFATNESETVGAISVLTALELDLPIENDVLKRDWFIDAWFAESSPAKVRNAALGYFAKCGTERDFAVAKKEYDRSDHGTSRSALECMIEILLRTGQVTVAQKLVLESQFESLNSDLLESVLEGFEDLETSDLLLGLEHSNGQVRLRAMQSLHDKNALDISMAKRLSEDNDAQVRRGSLEILLKLGESFSVEEVKNILVQPQKQTGFGLLYSRNRAGSDKEGEELFRQYELDVLMKESEENLEKKVASSLLYDNTAYFALASRYFRNHIDELRRDIDDKFSAYSEGQVRRTEAEFGDNNATQNLIKKYRDLEEHIRKDLTRKGLDLLCVGNKPEDLKRIRSNLRDGFTNASKFDAQYLRKHGDWTDISLLANAEPPFSSTLLTGDKEFQSEVAKAITSMCKQHSVSDLFSLEMSADILQRTIALCSESRFSLISREALLALFDHETDGVRKAAAIMAVRAFPAKRIKSVLHEYVSGDKHRYYNVIHWLDLGASMNRRDAKKVARGAEC